MFRRIKPPAVLVDSNHRTVSITTEGVIVLDQRRFDRIIVTRVAEVRAEYDGRLAELERQVEALALHVEDTGR